MTNDELIEKMRKLSINAESVHQEAREAQKRAKDAQAAAQEADSFVGDVLDSAANAIDVMVEVRQEIQIIRDEVMARVQADPPEPVRIDCKNANLALALAIMLNALAGTHSAEGAVATTDGNVLVVAKSSVS